MRVITGGFQCANVRREEPGSSSSRFKAQSFRGSAAGGRRGRVGSLRGLVAAVIFVLLTVVMSGAEVPCAVLFFNNSQVLSNVASRATVDLYHSDSPFCLGNYEHCSNLLFRTVISWYVFMCVPDAWWWPPGAAQRAFIWNFLGFPGVPLSFSRLFMTMFVFALACLSFSLKFEHNSFQTPPMLTQDILMVAVVCWG